jgi:hypothetical protein
MTAGERQFELCQALKAHKFELDNVRGVSAFDQEILDRRIEAVQQLLEYFSPALEPVPAAFPEVSPALMTVSGMVNSL